MQRTAVYYHLRLPYVMRMSSVRRSYVICALSVCHSYVVCVILYVIGALSVVAPVAVDANVAQVWSLSSIDMNDDDVDLMDSDDVLDDDDLMKPDPSSLAGRNSQVETRR